MVQTSEKGIKFIIAGLNDVGKTSIISRIFAGFHPEELSDLPPTRGIDKTSVFFDESSKLSIWEFGGQVKYRENYLDNPHYFNGTSVLIYVIDAQNMEYLDLSYQYFKKIVKFLIESVTDVKISILMHKVDPEIQNDLRSSIFKIRNKFGEIKTIITENLTFYSTSIYSDSLEFGFSKIIKDLNIPMRLYDDLEIQPSVMVEDSSHDSILNDNDNISPIEYLRNLISLDIKSEGSNTDTISGIFNLFHQNVMTIFKDTVNEYHGDQLVFIQVDQLIRTVASYASSVIDLGFQKDQLEEDSTEQSAIILANMNFFKVAFLNYLSTYSARRLSNRIKFLESMKSLVSELPLYALICDAISLEQYKKVVHVFDSFHRTTSFSLFPSNLSQKVYSFNNIDELKALNENKQQDPILVLSLIDLAIATTREALKTATEDALGEFPMISRFMEMFRHLKIEFYYLIKNIGFSEYDIKREIPNQIDSIVIKLLRIAKYIEVFTVAEKNELVKEISQL